MKIEDMVTLIEVVSKNGLTSFVYEEGDAKLILKKEVKMVAAKATQSVVVEQEPVEVASVVDIGADHVATSPLVGTFYSSASPEADAFVKVGDTVKKGQVLGIIEAMKLMNEIESEIDGVVEAVLVKNEEVVEFGQPLFRIR